MRFRIQRPERQILKLLAHLLHAHAARERRVDIERFFRDALTRSRRHEFQRAHVVQPIGKLDQQHTNIVGNRQQQLAQIFSLLGLARDQLQPFQFGQSLDQCADLVTEDVIDFGAGGLGILDGIVQQRGDDGGIVEFKAGQNGRDFERM